MPSYRYILELGEEPHIYRFSTTVRNELEPSNSTYPDESGNNIKYEPRLKIPTVNKKISDSISGATKLQQYNFIIMNDDGKYDDVESLDWFNIKAVLKRADIDNPTLDDFVTIASGEVDYPTVTQKTVSLRINDVYRALTDQVCKTFNTTDYPNVDDNVENRSIPIGYGSLKKAPCFLVDTNEYIILDPDYIQSVSAVYDRNGDSILFTYDGVNGTISTDDPAEEAFSADCEGLTNNTIGDIIINEIEQKSGIVYNSDNWDTDEAGDYRLFSANVNFYFTEGTVRQLIDQVLKNDNAFLFTKNRGVLTLRQWGKRYRVHDIRSWKITKFPTKDYQDAQRYFNSSVLLNYDREIINNIYTKQLLSGDDSLFKKARRVPYNVDIGAMNQLEDLAERLLFRFSELSEIINLASGESAITIDLLDFVEIDVNINGRQFSTKTEWVVRGVDASQDVLILEAKSGFVLPENIDGVLSQPYSNGISGVLSQPYSNNTDGVLSQPKHVIS